nr:T9SS type A sorting domain-containing protein [uncultured Arsenicibacter sp.]
MNKRRFYTLLALLWLIVSDSMAQSFTPLLKKGVYRPMSEVSYEAKLTSSGNYLYFVGWDSTTGAELLRTDGTAGGTRLVKDITPGLSYGSTAPVSLFNASGTLYFFAGTSLYKTDGTEAGTIRLRDFGDIGGEIFLQFNDLVIFKILGGLWSTDGTPEGTLRLAVRADAPKIFNKKLYFYTAAGSTYQETAILSSDGTSAGTSRIAQIPGTLQTWGTGSDGIYLTLHSTGFTSWKSDGTAAGTVQLETGSGVSAYFNAFGELYKRSTGTGPQPTWRQNRSTGAFEAVTPVPDADVLRGGYSVSYNGRIYGPASTTLTGNELSRLDGTPVRDLNPGRANGIAYVRPVEANGLLYFTGDDGTTGPEVWQTDGTADGTRLTGDLIPGLTGSLPYNLTLFQGSIYFDTREGALWKLTPPPALTVLTPSFNCTSGKLTIQVEGGSGEPIEYRVSGLRDWASEADFFVPDWQRSSTTFSLEARQNGRVFTQSFTSTCAVTDPAGTGNSSLFDVTLFPNPVADQVNLIIRKAAGQTIRLTLLNLTGQTMAEQTQLIGSERHTERFAIPAGAPAGVYLLQVRSGQQMKSLKVVKQ